MLIHIGYHKTGTTLLQRRLFRSAKAGYLFAGGVEELQPVFVEVNAFDFRPDKARILFAPKFEQAKRRGMVPVLSFERLSGAPHQGGYDSQQVADRLADTFPEARVLIVIREQRSMILSLYKTYVRMGGSASLEDYLNPLEGSELRTTLFRYDYLEYDKLIGYYQQLFGEENILALPYELLRRNPARFLKRVEKFSGAHSMSGVELPEVNVSPAPLPLMVKRHVNKWLVQGPLNASPVLPLRVKNRDLLKPFNRISRSLPRKLQLAGEGRWQRLIATSISGKYESSNAVTSALAKTDLQKFGYALPIA